MKAGSCGEISETNDENDEFKDVFHSDNKMAHENDVREASSEIKTSQKLCKKGFLKDLLRNSPQMVNIKNQLNNSSINLIDGDGLLFTCFYDENLIWNDSGGQFLHLMYIVERRLQMFLRNQGKFNVVFFKESGRVLWHDNTAVKLFREILILHLQKYMPVDLEVVTNFINPWDEEFSNYVKVNKPNYIFTCDTLDDEINATITLLHLKLVRFLQLGMSLVFLEDLQVTGSALNGFLLGLDDMNANLNSKQCHDFVKGLREKLKFTSINYGMVCDSHLLDGWNHFNGFKEIQLECYSLFLFVKTFIEKAKEKEEAFKDFIKLFLFYVLLKEKLPLRKRALPEVINGNERLLFFINNMQLTMKKVLVAASKNLGDNGNYQQLCDLWDGNLFMNVLVLIGKHKESGFHLFDESLNQRWRDVITKIGIDCHFPQNNIINELQERVDVADLSESFPSTELVRIESELMEKYAGDVIAEMDFLPNDDWQIDDIVSDYQEFKDLFHWHCNRFIINDLKELKTLVEEAKKNTDPGDNEDDVDGEDDADSNEECEEDYNAILPNLTKQQKKTMTEQEIRNYQREQRLRRKRQDRKKYWIKKYLQIYGDSLGDYHRQILPIVTSKQPKKEKRVKQAHPKQKNATGHKGKNKMLADIKDGKLKEIKENEKKRMTEILKLVTDLHGQMKHKEAVDEIEKRGKFFETVEGKLLWSIKLVGAFEMCLKHLTDLKEKEKLIVTIFGHIRNIQTRYSRILTEEDKKVISSCLKRMGFFNLQSQLYNFPVHNEDEKIDVQERCHIEYQMHKVGHLLPRNVETEPDSRVPHFIPDKWQRKLFDAIDNNQSVLVVAPTSSGKTYASYYCMEKILRSNDEDVVVYVSPTKALVNQIQAYVYKKFDKPNLPNGKVVCGVFTRDFRNDVDNCQILVTVPQCLEILLLSADCFAWSKKIKYVIFDEIHCVGGENGGEVWEHLLTLISSPFLALSATIKNPDGLHRWLQGAQDYQRKSKGMFFRKREDSSYIVNKVVVKDRHSDLENYMYNPKGKSLDRLHPYSVIHHSRIEKEGIPQHISLSPYECLQLFKALCEICPQNDEFMKFQPSVYFKDSKFLVRDDVRRYEKELKEWVQKWMLDRTSKNNFIKKNQMLKEQLHSESSTSVVKEDELCAEFVNLLNHLEENDKFPVIVFCLDRSKCEKLVGQVIRYFSKKEEQYYADKKEKKMSAAEKHKKKKEKDKMSNPDDVKQRENPDHYWLDHEFCPKNGSFAGKGVISKDDMTLLYLYNRLIRLKPRPKNLGRLMTGIRYGIGFHHSGMNNKMRSAVEILFRKKFLNIVVATSTLAVGIHVPCRSVVIASHNIYLDVLNFRQMAGRSGRRGFDMVGNVIFHAVPKQVVSKLMSGELPILHGNFPMSVTLCLRLMTVVEEVRLKGKSCEEARNDTIARVLTLLKNPLMLQQMPQLERQFKYFFVFSIQFLVREGMLKMDGKPQGLAGLAAHLFYHEPFNYAFIACIHAGTFHRFCERENAYTRQGAKKIIFTEMFLRELVMVLSHFFARRRLHASLLETRETSMVELEDLPELFQKEIEKYNCRTEKVYNMYLQSISNHVESTVGEDIELPLSRLKFLSTENTAVPQDNTVESELYRSAANNKCCSSFAALSGHRDNIKLYKSTDCITNVRHQVYTDVHEIPLVLTGVRLNSYVLDFFKHGNICAIVHENGLKHGAEFQLLKDFGLVLSTIACSLELFAPENDIVRKAFRQLADVYNERFNDTFYC